MPTLRDYQTKAVADIRGAWQAGDRNVCLQLDTGTGKTYVMGALIRELASERGGRLPGGWVLILCHRTFLVKQIQRTLFEFGFTENEIGIIASGHAITPWAPIQIATIQTIVTRLDRLAWLCPEYIDVDEGHHARAESWETVIGKYANANGALFTATPARLDGKGLGKICSKLILGPTMRQMVEWGYLAPTRLISPPSPIDRRSLERAGGQIVSKQADAKITRKVIVAGVNTWLKFTPDRQTIHFAHSRRHSRHHVGRLIECGIPAVHVDQNTPERARDRAFADLASGDIRVLSNVRLVSEGLDTPECSCVHFARFTTSLVDWRQALGRGMRPKPDGGDFVGLDTAGTFHELGRPEDPVQWTLEDGVVKESVVAERSNHRSCANCFEVVSARRDVCERCGHTHAMEMPAEVDMEMVEVAGGPIRKKTKHRMRDIAPRIYRTGGDEDKLYALADELGYDYRVVARWKRIYGPRWKL